MPLSKNAQHEIERLVVLVRTERRRRSRTAVKSLWRVGDGVIRLKEAVEPGTWSRCLAACATELGVHASSLVDAGRASEAFGDVQRRELGERLERAGTILTPSHVIELARAPIRQRSRGIEALLARSLSVRALRSYLRERIT